MRNARSIKILSMGDAEVGKSCIIKRLGEKRFVSKYIGTVGVDYGVVKVNLGDKDLRVNIFDLSGHNYFYEVRNEFYREVHGVFLVFDVSSFPSFEALDDWMLELAQELGTSDGLDKIIGVVCGNKCDKRRIVQEADARLWAELHGFLYFETSALSGAGISEMFEALFTNIIAMLEGGGRPITLKSNSAYSREQLQAIYQLRNAKDSYHKLGLSAGASKDEINRAYRRLAVLLHPDKSKAPGSEEAFKILATTKATLLGRH